MRLPVKYLLIAGITLFVASALQAQNQGKLEVREGKNVYEIRIDGKLFARYQTGIATKPFVWPIYASDGTNVTRNYPMLKIQGEDFDHPHHRGFWFTHGNVNSVDFWLERPGRGKVVNKKVEIAPFSESGNGKRIIRSWNDWMAPSGNKVLEDHSVYTFYSSIEPRIMDFEINLKASEGPVTFGDTKEGTCAIRVPKWMTVKAGTGHIETAAGYKDKDAWGKRAAWVDYFGPAGGTGRSVGVAILEHPGNFRYPTFWHARDYGLFTANPFGIRDFTGDKEKDGSFVLEAGQTLKLRYRVVVHLGDTTQAGIAKLAEKYQAAGK